jgi:hypothetical protein
MTFFINFFLFLIVLFLYIHITAQFKKSEDLEVYEMDYSDNTHLQEVCDVKQPVLFEFKNIIPDFFEKMNSDTIDDSYDVSDYDLKIKETDDYYNENIESVDYLVLPFRSSQKLLTSDTNNRYFTENNDDFVVESGMVKQFQRCDVYLKPSRVVQTKYDILMGSKDVYTPLRYHTLYRHFLSVNSGKITVKMTPFKSTKYLYPNHDFENYEFLSPVNVWKPQKKYLHEMDKLKFLEFDVYAGSVLYVPPYWWYSIKYVENDTLVCGFTYNSIINCVANSGNWARYFLQQNNIHKKMTKTKEDIRISETEIELETDKGEPDTELIEKPEE